jgi:Uma2 family endonuclease
MKPGGIMAQPVLEHPLAETAPLTLKMKGVGLSDEQFTQLVAENSDLRFEFTANKELVVMAPAGGETGRRNSRLNQRLANWTDQDGRGIAFDSSTGFVLPNGAKRSPDASWVTRERWDALSQKERDGFPPLCPDFVLELKSPSDSLSTLQDKMQEYLDNGARLGWLLDPKSRRIYSYRPDQRVEVLEQPKEVNGDPVLEGFVLRLDEVWG